MVTLPRVANAALGLLALAPSGTAQAVPPSPRYLVACEQRTASDRLASAGMRDVAWAAHVVAERRLPGCGSQLRAALARVAAHTAMDDGQCAALALLDALIRTEAAVPAAELEPFERFTDPVLVLAARDPAANRALLLRSFGVPSGPFLNGARAACGNLLASLREPDFVRVLVQTPAERFVFVHDPGNAVDLGDATGSRVTACGRRPQPKDFPPIARYRVFPAATGVGWHRGWYHGGLHCESSEIGDGFRDARRGWLVAMLGEAFGQRSDALDAPVAHAWKDRAALDVLAAELRNDSERQWRELIDACVDAKLFTADTAPAAPPVMYVTVLDCRERQVPPLPYVPPPWLR